MFNLDTYFSNYQQVYLAITCLVCLGMIISSSEYLSINKEFKDKGVFSWKVFSSRPDCINNYRFIKHINFLFGHKGFIAIHTLCIVCCVTLPFVNNYLAKALLISIIAIVSLIFSFRNIVGNDGSDQMNSVIFITLFIVYLANDPFIYKLGLIFIAGQSVLSYVTAGIAKLLSPKWRSGLAIQQIMNTRTYGHQRIATYLTGAHVGVNYFVCWFIIVFESVYFLALVLPSPGVYLFLLCGILFHFYNAVFMGLNNFFWSFIATYPAIIFLNQLILHW